MAIYQQRDIEFVDTAPVRIEAEVVVDASPEAIWEVLTDDEAWPEWFGSPLSAVERTSTDRGVGSTRRVTLGRGRAAAVIDERFIAWEPHRLWAFTGVGGPPLFRSLVERCTIHVEGPGRTRITYTMAIEPPPAARPLFAMAGAGIRRSLTRALRNLGARAAEHDRSVGD